MTDSGILKLGTGLDPIALVPFIMTATAHALVGGVIAAALPNNPVLGITLSALSHPILDMVPHWDFGRGWKQKSRTLLFFQASADLIFGIVVTFIFFGKTTNNLYLLLSILISESWDIIQVPYWLLGWKFFPFSAFYNFQHLINKSIKAPWGIVTQAVTITGIFLVLRTIH